MVEGIVSEYHRTFQFWIFCLYFQNISEFIKCPFCLPYVILSYSLNYLFTHLKISLTSCFQEFKDKGNHSVAISLLTPWQNTWAKQCKAAKIYFNSCFQRAQSVSLALWSLGWGEPEPQGGECIGEQRCSLYGRWKQREGEKKWWDRIQSPRAHLLKLFNFTVPFNWIPKLNFCPLLRGHQIMGPSMS